MDLTIVFRIATMKIMNTVPRKQIMTASPIISRSDLYACRLIQAMSLNAVLTL